MTGDPYPVLKRSLTFLRESVVLFDGEIVTTDKHDLWSVKKLIALKYYLKPYLTIMRKKGFKKIHYVDLFSGSGLLRIKNKIMPGTSLIPLLETKELIKHNAALFLTNTMFLILTQNMSKFLKIEQIKFQKDCLHLYASTKWILLIQ